MEYYTAVKKTKLHACVMHECNNMNYSYKSKIE